MSACCREDDPLIGKRSEGSKTEVLNPTGEVSFWGGARILFCTAVGAGVVAVPRAFSLSGWAAGLLALTFSAALSGLSLGCLFQCAKMECGSSTYQSLVHKYLPAGLSLFVEIATGMLLLGAIGSMLLLGIHVWQSVELAVGVAPFNPSHMPWALVALALLLCLPRSLAELQGVSIVNVVATLSVMLIISLVSASMMSKRVGHRAAGAPTDHAASGFASTTSLTGLLSALPITLYGFFCQFQAPQLFTEMRPSDRHKAFLISGAATTACFLVYACVGLLGYAAFGSNTDSDILAQLTKFNPTNHWLYLGQLLFGCVLLLSTPLVLAPLRSILLRRLAKEMGTFVEAHDAPVAVHVATTAAILVSAMLVALNVPGVDFIMGILGATCVVFLALIIPGLLTLNCCASDWRIAGHILLFAGFICSPLTFGTFVAQHFGYLPR